jgi:hypothetical protein
MRRPLRLSIQHLIFLNVGQEGKINLLWGQVSVGGGRHKERGNEGVYGRYILYHENRKMKPIGNSSTKGEERKIILKN